MCLDGFCFNISLVFFLIGCLLGCLLVLLRVYMLCYILYGHIYFLLNSKGVLYALGFICLLVTSGTILKNISRYLAQGAIYVRYLAQKKHDISQKRYLPESQR